MELILVLSGVIERKERFSSNGKTNLNIGRESANDICLDSRGVSRYHCRLSLIDNQWHIEDLGSRNGIQLLRASAKNSVSLRSASTILQHDDVIEVGEAKLAVRFCHPYSHETELISCKGSNDATAVLAGQGEPTHNQMPMHEYNTIHPVSGTPVASDASRVNCSSDFFSTNIAVHSEPSKVLRPPFQFRDFHVTRKIGEGGMGEVFAANRGADTKVERFAIKFLRNQEGASELDCARFLREMDIATRLRHRAIVECIDCGEVDGRLFIVMPFCAGGNLAEFLSRVGRLELRRGLRLIDRLLAGLEHAHSQGIVHRDVKPSNVLLAKSSKAGHKYLPKISDFGLAKSYLLAGNSGMTVNGTVGGSWPYMPREQLTNFRFVTPQSDIWSMGALLYECLTLRTPRVATAGADPIRVVMDSVIEPIESFLPDLSEAIRQVVMKSLATDPSERFEDASQMRAALRSASESVGIAL